MITEDQKLKTVSNQLRKNSQTKNQPEPISNSMTESMSDNFGKSASGEGLCSCGKKTKKLDSSFLNRDFYLPRCEDCEAEHKLKEAARRKEANEKRYLAIVHDNISRIIPVHYHNARLTDLSDNLFDAITSKPAEQGLYLWGPCGTGKTHAAACLAINFIGKRQSVTFVDFGELLLEIREGFQTQKAESQILRPYLDSKLTILDDIGTVKNTEFAIEVLRKVINKRINKNLPTILTSNLSPENLGQIDERINSRLKTFLTIKLGGKDKRDPEAKNPS